MAAKAKPGDSSGKSLSSLSSTPELLAKIPAIVWTTDKESFLTSLCGAEVANAVVDPMRHVGKPVSLLLQAGDSDSKVRDAHFLASLGENCTFDFELGGRDFHAQVSPLRGQNGQVTGVIGIALDQTDQLVSQRALRLSEQNYRSLIEESPHAICRCTPGGSLLQVNRAMQEMLGYAEADLLMLNLQTEIFSEPEQYVNFFQQLLRDNSAHAFEAQWLGAGHRLLHVSLGGRAIRDSAGELLYTDLFAENITERRLLEEQLRHAQKMQAIGQLAGGIAHDFNNLLTVIRGQAEMMSEEMLASDPLAPRLEEMERAAERATTLTRQLLAFSRKQVLQSKVIDLNSAVENMSQMLSRLIGENIELVFRPASQLWRVKIDPGQIEQVLMNLAVNARDAMPNGGQLVIESRNVDAGAFEPGSAEVLSGNYIRLSVTDNGHGMDEATCARVFEPFFTTKPVGKGTGLGLAVVYGVIKQSGGHIRVESKPGAGTSFHIYLPSTEAAAENIQHIAHGKMARGNETILLVEDDEPIRHMLTLFLRNHGYHVVVASDGQEAENIAHSQKPDVLLSDVMMPRVGGRELALRMKTVAPGIKTILMSGHTEDLQLCTEGVYFLQKPFSMHALSGLLREVIEGNTKTRAASSGLD